MISFRSVLRQKAFRLWKKRLYTTNESRRVAENVSRYPRTIVSGIQPTGSVHLGNYLGAIKQWVHLQNEGEDMVLFIADLHSITLPQDPKKLQKSVLEMTATLLACGVDSERSCLFLQSSVPQHTSLCWILQCISSLSRLERLSLFREKVESSKEVGLGVLVYPVLQAADILLYRGTHVPVGEDQLQHLQMAQQIATTFNHKFGSTFPIPHSLLSGESTKRIKSLRNPAKKMSKSDPDEKSRIMLVDSDEEIKKKFRKAVSDFTPEITYDPETRAGVSNLINIHSILTNTLPEEICEEMAGKDTLAYKYIVADAVCQHIHPIRQRIKELLSEPDYLVHVLNLGRDKALRRAEATYREVANKIGLSLPEKMDANKFYSTVKV